MFPLLTKTQVGCRRLFSRRLLHRITTLALLLAAAIIPQLLYSPPLQADQAQRPNIVLIMADDMGYSDIGCYGGEIRTPTLDRLAENGLRFTQFYNTGRCCPTRASLLTGLYPHQAGVGWMMTDRGFEGYRGDLNQDCVTIAEVLKPAGYATYAVGKWHVTKHVQPTGPKFNWPLQRGFDRFYGTITGAGSFFDPGTLTRDNTMISPVTDREYQPNVYYYTDAISDHAVRFLREHHQANPARPQQTPSGNASTAPPFFMYVAYTAAHWPMHALPQDIARYKGKYDQGYAHYRAERFKKMKSLGLLPNDWKLSPTVGDWDSVEHKAWEARCMEVYAAMVDRMDTGIGKIVQELKRQKQLDKTLILFLQDNGGCQEGVGRRGNWNRPVKPTLPVIADDAIRLDVIPKQNRRGIPTLQGPNIMPGPEDTYIAYGINWANVSNTPFREYKHFVHEGGIATPLIAHWPAGIQRTGELEPQPGHLIDILATCVDLAEADYPRKIGERIIQPMEGVSLAPAFNGKDLQRQQPLFWEHEGNRAVRDGDFKLVAKENRPWELYNLRKDRMEQHDLAASQPKTVQRLATAWDTYATRARVLPLGAWRGKKTASKFNKKQKKFTFQANTQSPREQAPFIEQRAFRFTVKIERPGTNGVLLAQGGSSSGYALYLENSRLKFALRNRGQLWSLTSDEALPQSACEVTVDFNLKAAVNVKVSADGQLVQKFAGQAPSLLQSMPIDGLQVGQDDGGLVAPYQKPVVFDGRISRVEFHVGRRAQAASSAAK